MRRLLTILLLLSVCFVAFIPQIYVKGDEGQITTTMHDEITTASSLTTTVISPTTVTKSLVRSSTNATSTLGEAPGEFIIKVDPQNHTIHRDEKIRTATYSVLVKALSGFRGEVELSIEGLPDSIEAIFNPEEGVPKPVFMSILKISVDPSTPSGVYPLTVISSSEHTVHRATATLVVKGESVTTTTTLYEKRMKVTVSTSAMNYKKGDEVEIFGFVKLRSGGSVAGANVSLSIVNPLGNDIHVRSMVTDKSGRYSDNFTLPLDAVEGTYAVYVSADTPTHGHGFARVAFTVGTSETPSIRIVNATVAMVNGTVSSEFHPGETFVVWVAVNNSGAVLKDGRIWVEVLDSNNVPITVTAVMVTIHTGEEVKTGIQVALKSSASTGTYTIRCLVSNAPITTGGRFLDTKETIFLVT